MAAPLTNSLQWFSWGANSYGQLGQGDSNDQTSPKCMNTLKKLPVHITGGGGHTLVVKGNGELMTCGSNCKGQLGLGHTQDCSSLQRVDALSKQKIVKVSGGWDFTVACTDTGSAYVWGSNSFGQLGLPHIKNFSCVPECLPVQNIQDISAGLRHTLLLDGAGEVYSAGAGRKGQLGIIQNGEVLSKSTAFQPVPCVCGQGKVVQVEAGSHHSVALLDTGQVLVWGCNKYGQCARDPEMVKQCNTPQLIDQKCFRGQKITSVCSGWTHLLALTVNGDVYSWGRADYGQLGRQCSKSYDWNPQTANNIHKVRDLSCGSEHNLAINSQGTLVSWAWNEHGICGTGDEQNVLEPQQVTLLEKYKTVMIGCGAGHSFAVCQGR